MSALSESCGLYSQLSDIYCGKGDGCFNGKTDDMIAQVRDNVCGENHKEIALSKGEEAGKENYGLYCKFLFRDGGFFVSRENEKS
ncbi:hypothetical protein [Propionispora sp. 2/2-37]|uniref:hypothetical protein n=1 Tax=Propionispora sp. 2/2-37 TaxID=1677858 RepID=UPI0012E1A67F|nr:hypothetical protein [Propionispora sp. 2/2-37]